MITKSTSDIIGNIIALFLLCVTVYIFKGWHAKLMESIGIKLRNHNKKKS